MSNSHLWSNKHGLKRPAEDELEGEQRLAKRFNLLNLEHNGKLWMNPNDITSHPNPDRVSAPPGHRWEDDFMQVEDTKDKIYIHNLDEELAEVDQEPQENRLIFIPDIERHLNKIPKHVLTGGDQSDQSSEQSTGHELVLYSVPSSLSVPPERDPVRRAILESRARSLQAQVDRPQQRLSDANMQPVLQQSRHFQDHNGDDEAMEIE